MYQMVIKYTKCRKKFQMAIKYIHFAKLRPSKINQNWDFWFENKPSGNPARRAGGKKERQDYVITGKIRWKRQEAMYVG
jgi:hypothetical protein